MAIYVSVTEAALLVEHFTAIAAATFQTEQVSFDARTNISQIHVHVGALPANQLKENGAIKTFVETWRDERYLYCTSLTIRSPQNSNVSIVYNFSPPNSTVEVNLDTAERTRLALTEIEKRLRPMSYVDQITATLSASERAGLQLRERTVSELSAALDRLGRAQADLIVKDAEERRRVQKELDDRYQAKLDELEKAHRERESELAKRSAEREGELAKKEKEHADRVAAFETEEAKLKRRALEKQTTELVDKLKTYSLSTETGKKRRNVHLLCGLMMGSAFLIAVAVLAAMIFRPGAIDARLFIPLGASTAALVSTFIYYVKWNDRWFREHADREMAASQYHADILRASWVAELVSQWYSETEDEPPPELINAFTRNIFRDVGPSRESEHPIESLTGMIKRITSVTVGKGVLSVQGLAEKAERSAMRPRKRIRTRPPRAPSSAPEAVESHAED